MLPSPEEVSVRDGDCDGAAAKVGPARQQRQRVPPRQQRAQPRRVAENLVERQRLNRHTHKSRNLSEHQGVEWIGTALTCTHT